MATISGKTGSGKSYAALTLAMSIDPYFEVEKQMVFNSIDFMKLINSGILKKGNAVIFDEAGVGVAARDWNSQQNKIIERIFQIFRTDNLAVILTVPSIKFIDTNVRALMHTHIVTMRTNYKEARTKVKVYDRFYNPIDGQYYPTRPKWGKWDINIQYLHKPPAVIWHRYEILRKIYADSRKEQSLEALEDKPKKKVPMYKLIQQEFEKGLSVKEIAAKYDTSPSYVSQSKINFKYKIPIKTPRK